MVGGPLRGFERALEPGSGICGRASIARSARVRMQCRTGRIWISRHGTCRADRTRWVRDGASAGAVGPRSANDPWILARIREGFPAKADAAYTPTHHVSGPHLFAYGVVAAFDGCGCARALGSFAATRTASNARTSLSPAVTTLSFRAPPTVGPTPRNPEPLVGSSPMECVHECSEPRRAQAHRT